MQGEIQALNFILDRTVYVHDEDGGTLIIPGHGRVTDEWEVAEYRDMLVIIRDRVQALITVRRHAAAGAGGEARPPTTTSAMARPADRGRPTCSSKRCTRV